MRHKPRYPVKTDEDFRKHSHRRGLWNLFLFTAGIASLVVDAWTTYSPGIYLGFGFATTMFGLLIWARKEEKILTNYHCPLCAMHLKGPLIRDLDGERQRWLTFDCNACKVTWDTGLRENYEYE